MQVNMKWQPYKSNGNATAAGGGIEDFDDE